SDRVHRNHLLYFSSLILPITYITLFFFTDTPPTEIYTLSLHDALPISPALRRDRHAAAPRHACLRRRDLSQRATRRAPHRKRPRSEEHTSELQSRRDLVCRLLLEKKKEETSNIISGTDTNQLIATTFDM